jgi:hypothetical protein
MYLAMGRSGVAGCSVCAGRMPTLPCGLISIDAQHHLTVDLRLGNSDAISRNSVPAEISFAVLHLRILHFRDETCFAQTPIRRYRVAFGCASAALFPSV